jgi:hypothetical protein
MGLAYMTFCTQEARASYKQLNQMRAYFIAQAGIERAHAELEDDWGWSGVTDEEFGGGAYSVTVSGSTTKTVTSVGEVLSRDGSTVLAARSIEATIQE